MRIKKDILYHNLKAIFLKRKDAGVKICTGKRFEGQASLEFALILPVLIIIILMVSQLGYLVYLQNVIEHAAREGARILVTTNSERLLHECIYKTCSGMEKKKLDIEILPSSPVQRNLGDTVNVRLCYRYSGFAGVARLLPGDCIAIRSNCSMRMECGNE
ncbi:MAG: pilus assembly protein [Actinobacteria bacterium]|nr:pilus assembly protein [Actinomycetota bacterium]